MNRRGFLASMLALGAAPAIVRAESLMSIVMRRSASGLLLPTAYVSATAKGVADGLTWATAFRSIGEGVRRLAPGGTLFVGAGYAVEGPDLAQALLRADRTVWDGCHINLTKTQTIATRAGTDNLFHRCHIICRSA